MAEDKGRPIPPPVYSDCQCNPALSHPCKFIGLVPLPVSLPTASCRSTLGRRRHSRCLSIVCLRNMCPTHVRCLLFRVVAWGTLSHICFALKFSYPQSTTIPSTAALSVCYSVEEKTISWHDFMVIAIVSQLSMFMH